VGERDIARSGFCGKTAAISGDILLLLAVLVSSHGDSCGSARIPKNVLGDRETLGRVKASGNVLSSLSQRFVGVLNSGEDPCQYRRASCHERPQEADARSETNARIRIQNVFFKPVGRSDRRVVFCRWQKAYTRKNSPRGTTLTAKTLRTGACQIFGTRPRTVNS
jgi:hypothetical protein